MSRRSRKLPQDPVRARIDSMSHEGRGVAKVGGKTVFIDGALPGEEVLFRFLKKHASFDEGMAVEILVPSAKRIAPGCPHFQICGGCRLQHLSAEEQIRFKEGVLLEQLKHIGGVSPETVIPALRGPEWGYRRKARLGVKYVEAKGRVVIGFREKQGRFLADLDSCPVLHPAVGDRLLELQALITGLSIRKHIPQIEVAVGEQATVLVFRHMQPFLETDLQLLGAFQTRTGMMICLQPGGPETVTPLAPGQDLFQEYSLPGHEVSFRFHPLDFTQVNFSINEAMVDRVIGMLQPEGDEQVLDLFCGLGNFSLPLARCAGRVTGVEGDRALVQRATENAGRNGLSNVDFQVCDLLQEDLAAGFLGTAWDKVLLDPPRLGAREVLARLTLQHTKRLVYVSCNPATLARDAGILVREKGFRLVQAGVMDMFPHTAHVESIACFER